MLLRNPLLSLYALFTTGFAGVLRQNSQAIADGPQPREVQSKADETTGVLDAEASAMRALDAATFVTPPLPNNDKVYNSWNLHLCAHACDSLHSIDRTPLAGHPLIKDIPIDDLTFGQCTHAFVDCNNKCQDMYLEDMKYWPPQEATWPVHTSSKLTICINACDNEATNDPRKVVATYGNNLLRDGTFSFVNQYLSNCTQTCQLGFNKEMDDFQIRDD